MTNRDYKITATPAGTRGTTIFEFRDDGERDRLYLYLHPGAKADAIDVVTGLQKAYESGREDRSEDILGDAGLDRAAAEVDAHGYATLGPLDCVGQCRCGRFEGGTIEQWRRHLAYEILQAAATEPRSVGTPR